MGNGKQLQRLPLGMFELEQTESSIILFITQ